MIKRNLLDTHTIIWFIDGSKEISREAREEIESENAANFISIASLWEMAIKISLGKLVLRTPFNQISIKLAENGFAILPVTFEDTLIVSALPFHHRDPFDRLIVAQSMTNKLSVISKDDLFSYYSIKVIW